MGSMPRRIAWTTAGWALAAIGFAATGQAPAKTDADNLERKINAIVARGAVIDPVEPPTLRTTITDREENAHFRYQGAQQLPVGVVNPQLTILDGGRVSGMATVDLDAVRRAKEASWTDPVAWGSGTLNFYAVGRLRGVNGRGVFELESASVGALPIPKAFL